MNVLTADQIRLVEERAVALGTDYLRLMESAGTACSRIIDKMLAAGLEKKTVAVVCGKGKNGGDGFVIARKLCEAGCRVAVVLACGSPAAQDSVDMMSRLKGMPINVMDYSTEKARSSEAINSADIIVDAIFGIGFKGELSDAVSEIVDKVNTARGYRVSIDIPSGLESDSGKVRACIMANITVAISTLKPAHILMPSSLFCGELKIVEIGIPASCYDDLDGDRFYVMNYSEVRAELPARNPLAHKGTYGKLLCICGSKCYQGAAALSAQAAVNSGAGVVTLAVPECAYAPIAAKMWETPMLQLDYNNDGTFSRAAIEPLVERAEDASVILLGCGIGANPDTEALTRAILSAAECPVVLDADGLNVISGNVEIFKDIDAPVIITPHPGEMARLTGKTVAEVNSNRLQIARDFAEEYGVTVVLKGANTVVAYPGSIPYVNTTGNAGLATGGSGDVLAGMIASFVAQGMGMEQAAVCGVYLHGMAGDKVSANSSMMGTTPAACLKEIPLLLV